MDNKKFSCQVESINVEGVLERIQVTCRIPEARVRVTIEKGVFSKDYTIEAENVDKVTCFIKSNEKAFHKEIRETLRINTWSLVQPFGKCLEAYSNLYILILTHDVPKRVENLLLKGNRHYAKVKLQKEEEHDLIQGVVSRSKLYLLDQARKFVIGTDVYTVIQTN
jgi:hypothetical protein